MAYEYAFDNAKTNITIYDAKHLNEKLYSTAPFPEFGGLYRQSNTLVLGAKFETVDYKCISEELHILDKSVESLMNKYEAMSCSQYIEEVARIHHRSPVIHAFRDGNGRISRAFANMMLLKRNIAPVFFDDKNKNNYKEALKIADTTGNYNPLFEIFFKTILISNASLSDSFV